MSKGFQKSMLILFIVVLIFFLCLEYASAQTLSISVSGDVNFRRVTLNGNDQTTTVQGNWPTFTCSDTRSTPTNGWHVDFLCGNFTDGSGHYISSSRTASGDDGFYFVASGGRIKRSSGSNVLPAETNNSGYLGSPLKVLSATGNTQGEGVYTYRPDTSAALLYVPAETYAGNYTAVFTATMAELP